MSQGATHRQPPAPFYQENDTTEEILQLATVSHCNSPGKRTTYF